MWVESGYTLDSGLSGSSVSDSVTLWTVAHQALVSAGFSRQEYWSGLSSLTPGGLPNPGIRPATLPLQDWRVDSSPPVLPGKPHIYTTMYNTAN